MEWKTPVSGNSKSNASIPTTSILAIKEPKLDLYAQKFIPAWLQQINAYPARQTIFSPSPTYVNFEEYAQSFLPKALFNSCSSTQFLASIQNPWYALDASPVGPQIPVQRVDTRNYPAHFRNVLIEERRALAEDFKQYNLFEVPLEPAHWQRDVYQVNVPGLREYIPAVYVGDTLIIRAIRATAPSSLVQFDGIEFIAYIWAIDRLRETIILHLPDLSRINLLTHNIPLSFNVQFYPRNTVETYQMMAADVFGSRLASDDNWSKRMLFPEERHAIWLPQRELGRGKFNIEWVDKELNYEQQKSVDAIVSGSHGDLPFLIYGPPGTGKTKTVIEAILQLIRKDNVHILAVAPSPSAADTIALRLVPHLKPGEMYRINDITRTFPEVPDNLMLFCHTAETHFSFPPWEKLMAAKVVVTDCMSSFELIKARCTNQDIALVQEMYGPAVGKHMTHWHWTHLFVDEAAQAREPETLIPLMIVAPKINVDFPMPKLVLAGDSNQLGPSIVSSVARENGIDVSLFDRLLRRPIYSQHPLSRQNVYRPNTANGWFRPAFVNLIRNYRSHPGILMMPSAMFYNSTLLPEAKETLSLLTWTFLPNPRIPVVFEPSSGDEIWIADTAGWYNPSEIAITTKLVLNLLDKKNTPGTRVLPDEVAVIAPFREHVVRMRVALRTLNLRVSVGTVENYQGGERRVTILNCVRSKDRFLSWDRTKGRGIIGERRRFNVAITRAKELLIIVGNPIILQTDPYWRGYLSFIKRNKLAKEPFSFADDKADRWMSSLERGMHIRDEVLRTTNTLGGGTLNDVYSDEAMWNVGAVLERLVLEEDDWYGELDVDGKDAGGN